MSKSVVFEVFCSQNTGTARAAGAPVNRQVRLQTDLLTKETDLSKTNFDAVSGGIAISMNNLTPDVRAAFPEAARFKVTIEPIE
jgi:hypothetical protein